MKIVVLTSRFPYPIEKGDKLRVYHQIVQLSQLHDIYLISICESNPLQSDLDQLLPYVKTMDLVMIKSYERYWSLTKAVFSITPFQIAWFHSDDIAAFIAHRIKALDPDHIYCQLTRMSSYVKGLSYSKTLDYMDSFGIGMLRRATVAHPFLKWLYKLEAKRMIKYEADIAKSFDHLTIISQQDKDNFTFAEAKKIHVIGNGIDESFFNRAQIAKTTDIVFVGNMGYLPNIEAAEYIAQQITPRLPLSTRVLIAGANPSSRVTALESDQITTTGWMPDIKTAYLSARIFVAPLWSGTGQQNKILEAMALGVPCITTSAVNNAIGAAPNHEILIAESTQNFIDAIHQLQNNPDLYQKIKNNATTFVKNNFDWKHNCLVLSSIIENKKSN